jgi:antitoxin PrlF
MPTALNSKGQVTIPKRLRDELQWLPGTALQFSINAASELVLQRPAIEKGSGSRRPDRFDTVQGRADVRWRTDDLMALLRPND